jgi:hypothetical protein
MLILRPANICQFVSKIQGYYKRNREFKLFVKPKLFKISTLTMHGFVEKLWKSYTAAHFPTEWSTAPLAPEVRNYPHANLPQRWIGRTIGDDMSLTCWPPESPDLTPCDLFFMGICQRQGLRPSRFCYFR